MDKSGGFGDHTLIKNSHFFNQKQSLSPNKPKRQQLASETNLKSKVQAKS